MTIDTTAPIKVLLVEDAESFVDALVVGLEREGFDLTVARDGIEALERFDANTIDLVLLDLMLPRMSGIDVCRAIRAQSDVPIIMVTAKSTELDTVVGLEVGADDYVAKPYRLRELVSRMRAVLRRRPTRAPVSALYASHSGPATGTLPNEDVATADSGTELPRAGMRQPGDVRPPADRRIQPVPDEVLEVGDVHLDVSRHECIVRGDDVKLPLKEFELLEMLLSNPGRVVTRDTLIDRVWGWITWVTPRRSTCISSG